MSAKPSILVVDDEQDLRVSLAELLMDEGYHVTLACHGLEAINYLKSHPNKPDLILLDYMMPYMDAKAFRAEQLADTNLKGIPTVLLSAAHIPHDVFAAVAPAAWLKKPIDIDKLLDEVHRHLKDEKEQKSKEDLACADRTASGY